MKLSLNELREFVREFTEFLDEATEEKDSRQATILREVLAGYLRIVENNNKGTNGFSFDTRTLGKC